MWFPLGHSKQKQKNKPLNNALRFHFKVQDYTPGTEKMINVLLCPVCV